MTNDDVDDRRLDDQGRIEEALAGPPFFGRWRSVTWRDSPGSRASHVADDEEGAVTLCGLALYVRPPDPFEHRYQDQGPVTCDNCRAWLLVPYRARKRPEGVTIPQWNLERSLRERFPGWRPERELEDFDHFALIGTKTPRACHGSVNKRPPRTPCPTPAWIVISIHATWAVCHEHARHIVESEWFNGPAMGYLVATDADGFWRYIGQDWDYADGLPIRYRPGSVS